MTGTASGVICQQGPTGRQPGSVIQGYKFVHLLLCLSLNYDTLHAVFWN